jgi:hemerythrin
MGKNTHDGEKQSGLHPILLGHNIFIVWKPEYNLGIPIIDEHHRGIVSTINSLHFGMLNNYARDILTPIVDMMYDYTRIHFRIEENFLEMIDFPNAQKHQSLHHELSTQLNSTGRHSIYDRDPYEFMDFLKNWWINHICNEDLIFKNYLIFSGQEETQIEG